MTRSRLDPIAEERRRLERLDLERAETERHLILATHRGQVAAEWDARQVSLAEVLEAVLAHHGLDAAEDARGFDGVDLAIWSPAGRLLALVRTGSDGLPEVLRLDGETPRSWCRQRRRRHRLAPDSPSLFKE